MLYPCLMTEDLQLDMSCRHPFPLTAQDLELKMSCPHTRRPHTRLSPPLPIYGI